MNAKHDSEPKSTNNLTTLERKSERELVVARTVNGPARIVFEAWTKPELFQQWWIPKSAGVSVLSFEADIRTGGKYRLLLRHKQSEPMAFFGTYLEVTPHSRVVWTNEEAGDAGQVSTATFEERAGKTLVTLHELYPSKEALDATLASGSQEGTLESFEQLEALVVARAASPAHPAH